MESVFNKYGKPQILQSDNGTQFVPTQPTFRHPFQEFCHTEQIHHVTIPKGKPQQNGKVEHHIQTVRAEVLRVFGLPTIAKTQELVDTWLRFFNYSRPHLGIRGQQPNERYRNDPPPNVCHYLSRIRNDQLSVSTMCVQTTEDFLIRRAYDSFPLLTH